MEVYSRDVQLVEKLRARVRALSNKYLSVVRTEDGVNQAITELGEIKERYGVFFQYDSVG